MEMPTSRMDMLAVTDLQPPQPAQTIRVQAVKYVSMADWEKEQDELDSVKAQETQKENRPPAKKQKQSVGSLDHESFKFEEEAVQAMGDENWVGLLQRYSDAHPGRKLKYEWLTVSKIVTRFQCIVTIQGFTERFGCPDNHNEHATLSTKMLAKQYASKQAVDWLIKNGHMPGDGSVKFVVPTLLPLTEHELASEQKALQVLGGENWVGRLQDYCQAHRKPLPDYKEYTFGKGAPRFQYAATITEFANPFGRVECNDEPVPSFSSKKLAKQYAAKQAIDALIRERHMPAEGAVTFPKPTKIVQPLQPSLPKDAAPQSPSYTTKVPDLCYRLNFPVPTYVLSSAANIPNCPLWDGHADFAGHPRIGDEGKVGRVKSIVGKKNAKEALAKQVYDFLKGVEADRLKQYNEEDKKRKRSPSSSQNEEMGSIEIEVQA